MADLGSVGKLIALLGVGLVVLGGLLWAASRLGFGGLPGDVKFNTAGWSCYVPIVTSIVLSIILTVLLNLFLRIGK